MRDSGDRAKTCKEGYGAFCANYALAARRSLASMFKNCRSGWDPPQFDEILEVALQNAFLMAHQRWERYDPSRSERFTWFMIIARCRVLRELSIRRRHASFRAGVSDVVLERLPGPVEDEAVLRHLAVEETLSRLAPAQAKALRLHYLEGHPVRDVAALMETSPAAVQSLLQRGRESFKRAFGEALKMEDGYR